MLHFLFYGVVFGLLARSIDPHLSAAGVVAAILFSLAAIIYMSQLTRQEKV